MDELNLTVDEYGGVVYPNEVELMNKINEIVRWINSH